LLKISKDENSAGHEEWTACTDSTAMASPAYTTEATSLVYPEEIIDSCFMLKLR
jgi:hypothetical protein